MHPNFQSWLQAAPHPRLQEPAHELSISIGPDRGIHARREVTLDFSSRLAMLEFGRQLVQEALSEDRGLIQESADGQQIQGVRLAADSARLVISYDEETPLPLLPPAPGESQEGGLSPSSTPGCSAPPETTNS